MAVGFTQLPGAKSITFYALNGGAGISVLHGKTTPPVQAGRTVMNGSIPYLSGRIRLMSLAIDPASSIQSIADMGVSGGETIPLISYTGFSPATTVGEKAWAIVIYDKLKHSYGQTAAFDVDSTPNVNDSRQSAINNGWINSSTNGHTTDLNHRWYENDERSLTIGPGAGYIDILLPSGVNWFTHGAQVSASATTANILALEGRIKLIEYVAQNVVATSPPANAPAAATLKGSGIAHEFMSYTNSSTPAVLFNGIDPVQGLIFDLADRPPIDFGIDVADSSLNGSTHWLHYSAKDKSDNIATTFSKSFKIDNDLPIISDVSINNGLTKTIDDEVMVYANIKDNTSGVIQYYISETLGGTEDTSTRLHTTLAPAISTAHTVDRMFVFNSTPGVRTLELKAMDQADNYTIESLTIEKSSQSAVWNNFTVTRDPITAFMVNINVDVQITPASPDELSQYYFTFDRFDIPDPADYIDLRNGMDTAHWIDNLQMVDSAQHSELYVFIKTRGGFYTKATAVIDNSNAATLGTLQSIDPAEGEIELNLPIKRTSNRRNSYRIRAKGNTAYYSNATQPNADLITGYTIRDDNTYPTNVPQYNNATLKYEDVDGDGWNMVDPVNNEYEKANQDFDFTGSGGTKTVRLFASTVGNVLISASEVVEFETDQEGPQANTVIIDGNTAIVTAGSAPNERFEVSDSLNIPSIPIQVDLYDKSDVYRWKFSAFQIPGYQSLRFDTTTDWNIESTPVQNLTLNLTVNFSVSSLNTYYLYSMDALENVSENRIKVEYIDPNDLAAMGGGSSSANNVMTKFEGKAHEHLTRNSITSMFGDGTRHETFMSLRHSEDLSGHQAKSITDSRTHKLSEYSGLRVYDRVTRTQTNLPDAGNPIKFSDFKDKQPLITSQRISAYTTDRTIEEIPNKIGDIRNFCVLMDIDTGIGSTPHIPLENQNLIDIDATWNVRFVPAFDNTIQYRKYPPNQTNFYTSNHGVLTCNFDEEGTYIVEGETSFGDVLIGTYFISNAVTIDPIPTHPSVLGPVPSSGSFDVSYQVNQLSLGVDAVFAFDASISYANGSPSFLTAAEGAFPTILNKIDDFSKDSAGNSSSRYAVVEFGTFTEGPYLPWYSGATNETTLVSNFGPVGNRSTASTALTNINLNGRTLGGVEAQWHVVKQIADQSVNPGLGDWRTTALKMILLFSDTSPDWPKLTDVAAREQIKNECVDALNNKEIYFVLFDGEGGINSAFFNQGIKFSSIVPLGTNAGDGDISAAMTQVFNDYQSSTSYDLRPHIPGIFKSCVANPAHHSGTVPIPFAEKTASGEVHFQVELDEDVISNFIGPSALISAGTSIQIETYIMTYNATNNPIQRQKLIISHTF